MKYNTSYREKKSSNKLILFAVAVISVVSISGALALSTSAAAQKSASQSNPRGFDSLKCCLYPMVINVTGVSVVQANGQHSVVVSLAASNNLGLNPMHAGAVVRLKSFTLTLSYQYQSPNAAPTNTVVTITPNLSLSLTPDQQKTFSVDAGTIQAAAGSPVKVQVSGSFTSEENVVASTYTMNFPNGKGLIPVFD